MSDLPEKVVCFEPIGRIHPSQWSLVDNPPEGYRFTVSRSRMTRTLTDNSVIFDRFRLQVLDRILPLTLAKAWVDDLITPKMNGTDLMYLYNHITARDIPWVVNVEWGHVLVGRCPWWLRHGEPVIEKALASEQCAGVTTWTNMALNSMLYCYDCSAFTNKMQTVYPATAPVEYRRDYNRDRVRLLFVGAANDPASFDCKGGWEVVQVFLALKEKYPKLELTIRSRVPNYIRKQLDGVYGVRVLENWLSDSELDKEFADADIYVVPSHKLQNMAVFDAMRYGLPIVTTWIGSSGNEFVENGVSGLVVSDPPGVCYLGKGNLLTTETTEYFKMLKDVRQNRHRVVPNLVSAVESLVRSPSGREELGRSGRREIENGRFSLAHRNKILKEIFDSAAY